MGAARTGLPTCTRSGRSFREAIETRVCPDHPERCLPKSAIARVSAKTGFARERPNDGSAGTSPPPRIAPGVEPMLTLPIDVSRSAKALGPTLQQAPWKPT